MKNVMYVGLIVLGTLGFSSCGGDANKSESSETVVDKDTVATEYKVEETTVEHDTNTTTTTVEADSTKH
jgi:hypothetical protein